MSERRSVDKVNTSVTFELIESVQEKASTPSAPRAALSLANIVCECVWCVRAGVWCVRACVRVYVVCVCVGGGGGGGGGGGLKEGAELYGQNETRGPYIIAVKCFVTMSLTQIHLENNPLLQILALAVKVYREMIKNNLFHASQSVNFGKEIS